jgi:broad specificity phosphatase PhoE
VTVVHLLRHGEVFNPDHVLYGRLPGFQLSLRGRQQADIAARYLAPRPIGYVVSSPLERARQTAAPLVEARGLPLVIDDRLIEAANELEGKHVAGGRGLLTDVGNWKYFRNPLRPSWGEPYEQIAERMLAAVLAACDAVAALPPAADGRALEAVCVSHQLPIYTLRRSLEGQRLYHDPRKRECGLASVTTLTFVDHVVVGIEYNEPAGATPKDAVAGA